MIHNFLAYGRKEMSYSSLITCMCSSALSDYAVSLRSVNFVDSTSVSANSKSQHSEKMDNIHFLCVKVLSPRKVCGVKMGEGVNSYSTVKKGTLSWNVGHHTGDQIHDLWHDLDW